MDSGLTSSVLMCHAPIVLPEIAGAERDQARQSTQAMMEAAQYAVSSGPDLMIVISPHTPRHKRSFGVAGGIGGGKGLFGNFGQFGSPEIEIRLPCDAVFADLLIRKAGSHEVPLAVLPPLELDHGAMVPLYFLQKAGWKGKTVLLSFPYYPDPEGCRRMGELIAEAARESGVRWAFVASGDMSHRLIPGAPGGFHPRAREFDRLFTERIRDGEYREALAVDEKLREIAGEDVVDSVAVAVAATQGRTEGHRVLSYEGPFGVGYLVAILCSPGVTADGVDEKELLKVARESIQAHLEGKSYRPSIRETSADKTPPEGVFVTLWSKTSAGERLRGCIGRHSRSYPTLAEEIADCAISAAIHDPRFPPVRGRELADLEVEISLLGKLEPVRDVSELDPQVYGVLMVAGDRHATLLPGIEGIDTVEKQLSAVRQKAGIPRGATVELYRYAVRKVQE